MPATKQDKPKSSTQSNSSATGFQLNHIAIALNLSIEKLTIGWRLEFSGSALVLHWRFVQLIGVPE